MLQVSKLHTFDPSLGDEHWKRLRIGKFSASEIGKLISAKSHEGKFAQGGLTYIQGKAGEYVTGSPAKADFHNANTDHGNAVEAEAIRYFQAEYGHTIFREEKRGDSRMLIVEDDFSCATPDALVVNDTNLVFSSDNTRLNVSPLEIKCPPMLHRFIKLYTCKTPEDLKALSDMKVYYYQVLTQMLMCESLVGYFACYHRDFPKKMGVITFNAAQVWEDLAKVKKTLDYAKEEMKKLILVLQ